MDKIFDLATNISTPLMLAGFIAAAFFFMVRQIIKANIFPQLTRQLSGDIIKIIIDRLFILALVAMIFGFIGYLWSTFNERARVSAEVREHYEMPAKDLIRLKLIEINAIDLGPRPDSKNIMIRFKVIPKSKDKFVPLKETADIFIYDSLGNASHFSFDVSMDDEGIRPQVASTLTLDGLIPRTFYDQIIESNNYKAKCELYYDPDVVPTDVSFITNVFELNSKIILDLSRPHP